MGQATAAAAAVSAGALEVGTLVKLGRVALLALVARRRPGDEDASVPLVPGFLVAFVVLVAVRTTIPVGADAVELSRYVSVALLTVALVAIGLDVDLAALRARGPRPLLLGLFAWIVAAGTALALIVALPV